MFKHVKGGWFHAQRWWIHAQRGWIHAERGWIHAQRGWIYAKRGWIHAYWTYLLHALHDPGRELADGDDHGPKYSRAPVPVVLRSTRRPDRRLNK
jgi:hypothetical protein